MSSVILDSLHKPSISIISALTLHPRADDFCRELALRGLHDPNVISVCILTLTSNAELHFIGRYGSVEVISEFSKLQAEIEKVIRNKNIRSHSLISLELSNHGEVPVLLVPSAPMSPSSGVLVVFFKELSSSSLDVDTLISLSFACEMYSSSSWSPSSNQNGRARYQARINIEGSALSPRQVQVLRLMADGSTNERIARLLNYSVATIKNDISAIFKFFDVNNRNDAITEARTRELLPPPPARLANA